MPVPARKITTWEYCNPIAFLTYLARISLPFFNIMEAVVASAPAGVLSILIYIDGICPGNPLRHDKGRELQAVHWAFAEWPPWLLTRTGAWPIFGVIRTSIVTDEFPGSVSELAKLVLKRFFPSVGPSFEHGFIVNSSDGRSISVMATFGGWLADEKALKEINDCKGASGAPAKCMHAQTHDQPVAGSI